MKSRKVEIGRTYVGIVEDNIDPKKDGRLKVRVLDVFDEASTEDLPWASPWKDLGGGQISIPEKGKVVIVVFEQADPYKPEYIFTEHWNINLENKLKSLSDSDYLSMKSLIFDHNTQIYTNESEGLKLDHKYNNINIKKNGINLNLKDNNMLVNIGDATANQQAILGNHFFDWFDKFIETLMSNTAFLGNAGAPVLTNPALIRILGEYKAQKDSMFLSHHVNIVDNNKVSSTKLDKREETAQSGDTWNSTRTENTLTTTSTETNKPTEGEKPKCDETHTEPPADKLGVSPTQPVPPKVIEKPEPPKTSIASNKKIEKIVWFLKSKNYTVFDQKFNLNIVAFRSKNQVKDDELTNATNKFDEELCVFYKNEQENWELFEYSISTVPGFLPNKTELPSNVSILAQGEYKEQLKLIDYKGDSNYKCLAFNQCAVHRNNKLDRYNFESPIELGDYAITIHRSSEIASSEFVFNYSEGAQVFKNTNQYEQFIKICQIQIEKAQKSTFTYTLCSKKEYDEYLNPDEQREIAKTLPQKQPDPIIQATQSILATQSITEIPTYKKEMESLISRRFRSDVGKPSIKYFLDKFTKDNSNSFEVSETISFAEGLSRDDMDTIFKTKLQGKSKSEIGDNPWEYIISKIVFPKLKYELRRHIVYLTKKGKLKKSDYFYIDSKGEISSEKGLIVWRSSFRDKIGQHDIFNKPEMLPDAVVSEGGFKEIQKFYTNLLDVKTNKLNPDKTSKNNAWVIEDKEIAWVMVEVKFIPFKK